MPSEKAPPFASEATENVFLYTWMWLVEAGYWPYWPSVKPVTLASYQLAGSEPIR